MEKAEKDPVIIWDPTGKRFPVAVSSGEGPVITVSNENLGIFATLVKAAKAAGATEAEALLAAANAVNGRPYNLRRQR